MPQVGSAAVFLRALTEIAVFGRQPAVEYILSRELGQYASCYNFYLPPQLLKDHSLVDIILLSNQAFNFSSHEFVLACMLTDVKIASAIIGKILYYQEFLVNQLFHQVTEPDLADACSISIYSLSHLLI